MTEQVHYRIDRTLMKRAKKVCAELGITPTAAVSMFFAQLVNEGGMPFRPRVQPKVDGLLDIDRRNRVLRELDDSEGWLGLHAGSRL